MHQIGELCSARRMLQRKKYDVQVAGIAGKKSFPQLSNRSPPVRFAMLKALFGGSIVHPN